MSGDSTLEKFNELAAQRLDRQSVFFYFSAKRPDSFVYKISSEKNLSNNVRDDLSPCTMDFTGILFAPKLFEDCYCELYINHSFKSQDVTDGCLGLGSYEKALNRFYFWLNLPSNEFEGLIKKWTLEALICSNVRETFGEEYWLAISLKCINFRRSVSSFSDGDEVSFDIIEGNF